MTERDITRRIAKLERLASSLQCLVEGHDVPSVLVKSALRLFDVIVDLQYAIRSSDNGRTSRLRL